MEINAQLKNYVETAILPGYDAFDEGHNSLHISNVIENALELAREFGADLNKVYTAAAYHDCGLDRGREEHHLRSATYLRGDPRLAEWFAPEEIELMAEAVEDHRASGKNPPRSLYGKILADADREYTVERLLSRTVSYGKKNYPQLSESQQIERAYLHCTHKYGPGGYMHFYLDSHRRSCHREMERLHRLLEDRAAFDAQCRKYL